MKRHADENRTIETLVKALEELGKDNNNICARMEDLKRQVSDYKAILHAVRQEQDLARRDIIISNVLAKYRDEAH